MASRAAAVMTENDGDNGADDSLSNLNGRDGGIPEGLGNGGGAQEGGGRPGALPNTRRASEAHPEPEFEVIETGEDGKPIGGADGARQVEEPPADEHVDDLRVGEEERQGQARRGRGEERTPRRERQKRGRDDTERKLAQTQAELEELRDRFGLVEPKLTEIDTARHQERLQTMDRDIAAHAAAGAEAKRKLIQAVTDGDAAAISEAMDAREVAVREGTKLENQKAALVAAGGRQSQQQAREIRVDPAGNRQNQQQRQAPLAPAVQANVNRFNENHEWFDPQGRDEDSQLVYSIDAQVKRAGFDPRTQDYWDELEERLERHFPHHYTDQQRQGQGQQKPRQNGSARGAEAAQTQQRQQSDIRRRGPAMSGNGDRRGTQGERQQVYIGPQRKQAMVDANIIDNGGRVIDADKYKRTLKGYADFDRENGTTNR